VTLFFRLINEKDKESRLIDSINKLNSGSLVDTAFQVNSNSFSKVPTSTFAYWVSEAVRSTFVNLPAFMSDGRIACDTNPAGDDIRFFRNWWEVVDSYNEQFLWVPLAKGGNYSPFYADINLVVCWNKGKNSYHGFLGTEHRPLEKPASVKYFFEPGLTWSRRSQKGLSMRVLPKGAIFAQKGPGVFFEQKSEDYKLAYLAVINSTPYKYLASLQMSFGAYEVGVIQRTVVPDLDDVSIQYLACRAKKIINYKKYFDSYDEVSHAFSSPSILDANYLGFKHNSAEVYKGIVLEIDDLCFKLYGFSGKDIEYARDSSVCTTDMDASLLVECQNDPVYSLLSWAVGVSFGRFIKNPEIISFDKLSSVSVFEPLPKYSLGMKLTQEDALEFLVDDESSDKDIVNIILSVLSPLDIPIDINVREWLKSQFFSYHLKQYSKSRRKAPIYWPLQSSNGYLTIWAYYPRLSAQSFFTCINDYVDPKIALMTTEFDAIKNKPSKTQEDLIQLGKLIEILDEIKDFREDLLKVSKRWKPSLDDGVQVSSSPFYKLIGHPTWRKELKKTWAGLENGEYDWARMAFNNWPERVLRKCHEDRSVAIAHNLEDELWQKIEVPVGKTKKTKLAWQPKAMTESELNSYIQQKIAQG